MTPNCVWRMEDYCVVPTHLSSYTVDDKLQIRIYIFIFYTVGGGVVVGGKVGAEPERRAFYMFEMIRTNRN